MELKRKESKKIRKIKKFKIIRTDFVSINKKLRKFRFCIATCTSYPRNQQWSTMNILEKKVKEEFLKFTILIFDKKKIFLKSLSNCVFKTNHCNNSPPKSVRYGFKE